jgi:hypothetical protein
MNERHRQQQFPSPFELPEMELDPEKLLWVPGRKKIFIPSAPKPAVGFDWSFSLEPIRPVTIQNLDFASLYLDRCICVPGRSEYMGISREVPITYQNIRRSERPAWRSRRLREW